MNLHVLSSYPFRNHPCKAHLTAITQVINRSRHTRNNAPSSSRSTASLQDISPDTPPSHADTADENDTPAAGSPAKAGRLRACSPHAASPRRCAARRTARPAYTEATGVAVLCFLCFACCFGCGFFLLLCVCGF